MTQAAIAKPRVRVPAGGMAFPAGLPSRPAPSAAFMRNEQMPLFYRWNPALRETSQDVKAAWRLATARSIDSLQNSGWLAGAAEQSAASVVGTGLTLNARPNAVALGWSQEEANAWARAVETRFSMWAEDPRACDAGGRFSFGQIQVQAYRHWMATGEILATLPFFRREGSSFSTKLRLLPAWRMSNRSQLPNLMQGVRLDDVGAAVAYLLYRPTPFSAVPPGGIPVGNMLGVSYNGMQETEVQARDAVGRPLVIHIFDGEPDQVRGISLFTPILKVTRQFDQLADATATAALIQTIFAAMFQSSDPGPEALAAMQSTAEQAAASDHVNMEQLLTDKAAWYKKTDIDLGVHGKVLHGFPGDELKFFRSETPNATYEPFARFLLREASRATAMTYEEFTGDWAGATFSSSKMGVATNWPKVIYRRRHIVAPLAQKTYEAWLEEDIEAGRTPFPGGVAAFLENREAAAQANWRGPTMPQADELKSAKAAQTLQQIGVPDAIIFEPWGGDVDDWYEMRKREQDRKKELGLDQPAAKQDPVGDALVTQNEKA